MATCGYNKGEPFEHNFPSNSLIILVILYFACTFLCILSINHVYIVYTAVLMGLGEILVKNSFWLYMYVTFCIFLNFNIQIQYKLFCVVFSFIPSLS